jgi:para-aminobenzoate synthetase component 1
VQRRACVSEADENPKVRIHPVPFRDPLAAFAAFASDPVAALLDSAASDAGRGRYAYIAAAPFRVISAGAKVRVDGVPVEGDPFAVIERELAACAPPSGPCPVPFRGGAVGFLGYELGRHLEELPAPLPHAPAMPDMFIGLYDVVAAFDLIERKAWVISTGLPEQEPEAQSRRADARARMMITRLEDAPEVLPPPDWSRSGSWQAERTRDEAEAAVRRAIDYIYAGDIYQANLTQRMLARRPGGLDDFTLYRRLRALSPAPFAAFLRCGPDLSIASASPERFLSLDRERAVETRPIKGTRPRGISSSEDAALAAELVASEKDRAENLMIVDLMRNDLGRVCEIGSVTVPQLIGLESFASVHHLVSVVTARLREHLGPVDLLRATFPGGSITGTPKIRAMEIIRELEPAPRGAYCGSILWIGFDGAMDSSIVIRTLTLSGEHVIAQAGGGIVADSDPGAEYEESLVKMAPLLRTLTGDRP